MCNTRGSQRSEDELKTGTFKESAIVNNARTCGIFAAIGLSINIGLRARRISIA